MKLGIVQKLMIGILLPLILILGIIGVLLGRTSSGIVEELVSENLTAQTTAAANQVDAFFQKYYGVAEMLSQSGVVVHVVSDTAKQQLADSTYYADLLQELRSTQSNYQDEVLSTWLTDLGAGEVLLSDGSHISSTEMDFTTREWYPMVMEQKRTVLTSAYTDKATNAMVVTIASPVLINDQVAGVVGIDLDISRLGKTLSQMVVGENGYITLYDCVGSIVYHPNSEVLGQKISDVSYSQNMEDALLNQKNVQGMPYTRDGTQYYGSTVHLSDLDYQVLGVLPTAEFTNQVAGTIRLVVVSFLLCAVLLAVAVTFLAISLTRPLKRLCRVADQLADGQLDVEYSVQGNDEISQVGRSTLHIVERLKTYIAYIDELSHGLEQVGDGNLVFQLQYDYQGDFARLKTALLNIQHHMSATLSGITQSALQVNVGAEQIASGAQALAQGSAEQASSVQELSATIQELNQQTNEGSEKAVEMSHHLEQVKLQMDNSNQQMKAMMQAMEEITRQSSAIGQIIKTIDDIAFQTNILALNAAVEAARAGSAGKGFAVVADEVRSLAAKSADAARDTNELIARSIQAVNQGESIATQTAQNLVSVSASTNQIVASIAQIAEAYHQQAHRLEEISTGVDRISNVVQTNSATAEQSAAASEELAGQASSMQAQVAHFRLPDSGEVPAAHS